MNPKKPRNPMNTAFRFVVMGKDQPEYQPLPAYIYPNGSVQTEWDLSLDERRAVGDGARIILWIQTWGRPLQPLMIQVEGVMEKPFLQPIKNGWAARGEGWAVAGGTRQEALEKYAEAERLHREIEARPWPQLAEDIKWREL